MTQPPDPAKLAGDLSQRIINHGDALAGPGKPPLKLLKWALGQLEECARTRSVPPSNVVDVAMEAIKEEIGVHPLKPPPAAAPAVPAAPAIRRGVGGVGGGRGNSKGSSSREKKSAAGAAGRGGGSGGRSKGKVVFTPLYGCEEGGTGVGPVSSILEVRVERGRETMRNAACGDLYIHGVPGMFLFCVKLSEMYYRIERSIVSALYTATAGQQHVAAVQVVCTSMIQACRGNMSDSFEFLKKWTSATT